MPYFCNCYEVNVVHGNARALKAKEQSIYENFSFQEVVPVAGACPECGFTAVFSKMNPDQKQPSLGRGLRKDARPKPTMEDEWAYHY